MVAAHDEVVADVRHVVFKVDAASDWAVHVDHIPLKVHIVPVGDPVSEQEPACEEALVVRHGPGVRRVVSNDELRRGRASRTDDFALEPHRRCILVRSGRRDPEAVLRYVERCDIVDGEHAKVDCGGLARRRRDDLEVVVAKDELRRIGNARLERKACSLGRAHGLDGVVSDSELANVAEKDGIVDGKDDAVARAAKRRDGVVLDLQRCKALHAATPRERPAVTGKDAVLDVELRCAGKGNRTQQVVELNIRRVHGKVLQAHVRVVLHVIDLHVLRAGEGDVVDKERAPYHMVRCHGGVAHVDHPQGTVRDDNRAIVDVVQVEPRRGDFGDSHHRVAAAGHGDKCVGAGRDSVGRAGRGKGESARAGGGEGEQRQQLQQRLCDAGWWAHAVLW